MRKFSFLLIIVLLAAAITPVHAAPRERQTTLKMGLLPILDVLPFYVAEQAGYFEAEGLNVELIPVSSALERDQLLLAGEIDGMLNDLISTGIFNQDESQIQIVAMARRAYPGSPQFRILAAPGSDISTPEDLAGVEIGISENSVIHYITQRILEHEGMSADDLAYRAEPNIPVRFQLLMEGTFKAVCLPDPLAQAAIVGGAILVADDTSLIEEEFSQSVLTFRTPIIEDNPEAVEGFLRAWMHAAEDINADPDTFRDLWLEKTTVPDSVKDTYVLPPFPTYAITSESAWNDTIQWLVDQDIVDNAAVYADSVNPTFIEAIKPADAGAGDTGAAAPVGDPENGEKLLTAQGCVACHSTEPDVMIVGPSLAGLADEEMGGMSAAEFIRQSIVEPGAVIAEGYADIMPPYNTLSESDLNDIIAYLLTLEE